jgi:hypothetical protein
VNIHQAPGRDIQRQLQLRVRKRIREPRQALVEDLHRQLIDQPDSFRNWNEVVGHDYSHRGMFPSNQSFKPGRRAGLAFDLWLIGHHKLMAIERALQSRLRDLNLIAVRGMLVCGRRLFGLASFPNE